ncbi:FkbM family methyltransferase [Achromobacter sp. Marseille-Q4954]|uniref:FkbM family methyltransferase n=1 Tax=Achromobacter sp. Marseille-Q4954 TaxID=2942203 RepID=UPI002073B901|nr:FkbM family methyltransferase [Achromobacter sp. Marseille-Q4954]
MARREIEELRLRITSTEDERLSLAERLAHALPEHSKTVFSHWGEDSIEQFIFQDLSTGRYLDIGCYHPALYSNTMALYQRGWTGVNVDPNPFMIEQCGKYRPKDTSINKAVGAEKGHMEYYNFHDWASSNTANKDFAKAVAAVSEIEVPAPTLVEVLTLADIINEYFHGKAPDFLNIDVEELDIEVLDSGDWESHRPSVVAVEDISFVADRPADSTIHRFMRERDYILFSRCIFTSLYIERTFNNSGPKFLS